MTKPDAAADPLPITAATVVVEIFDHYPAGEDLFRGMGLKCPDCVVCEKDTLADVARLYDQDLDALLEAVRKGLESLPVAPENA